MSGFLQTGGDPCALCRDSNEEGSNYLNEGAGRLDRPDCPLPPN